MTVSIPASDYLRDDPIVVHRASDAPPPVAIQDDAINATRFLAIDAAERAHSGHPGTPMALAPLVYRLFTRHLRHDSNRPDWPDRDRSVLSGGHASMLPYAALHQTGCELSTHGIREFRQWGSRALKQAQATEALSRYGNHGMGRRRPSGRETGDD